MTFPKSVNWIEPEAFFGSTKLTAVNVVAANAVIVKIDAIGDVTLASEPARAGQRAVEAIPA